MNYYVYIYLNKLKPGKYQYDELLFDYEPFYVGKGKDNRYLSHLNKIKNNCKFKPSTKFKIISDNLSFGIEPSILKIKENLSEDDSLSFEKELIVKIGRIDLNTGPLSNLNDGGMKPQDNYHHSNDTKYKISISGKNREPEKRYTIISPTMQVYEDIKLSIFCKQNDLDYQKMRKSSNTGKIKPIRVTSIKQSKKETINCIGWEVINKKITNAKSKKPVFKLISPDNTEYIIYKGDVIRDKCIELDLDQRTLRYYKNKGVINIKNINQSKRAINCNGWQFIALQNLLSL